MHMIKSTTYGALFGLAAALAMLIGLYASPLRQDLYFAVDPGLAEARANLRMLRDTLAQADMHIAQADAGSDTLRARQEKTWRQYKAWRTRLGELSRVHAQPGAAGLADWTYSLRYWVAPVAAVVVLLPALLAGWRARSRFRPPRARPGKARRAAPEAGESAAKAKAISDFEDAVKKVARISRPQEEKESVPPAAPDPVPARGREPPPTDVLPISALSRALEDEQAPPPAPPAPPARKDPDTVPFKLDKDAGPEAPEKGRETSYFQVGPGWGDARPAKPGLSMEDEDAPPADGGGEEALGVMPPTTEVERVERRKEEVLKLARKGLTSSEISRRMRISQDQVEFIIRLRREKG